MELEEFDEVSNLETTNNLMVKESSGVK